MRRSFASQNGMQLRLYLQSYCTLVVLEGIRKTCIFFMLWGLTRAMIKMFVEKERGVDRILQNVPLGQLKKGKTVFSSPVLSEL